MVLISSFQDVTSLSDGDFFLIEKPGGDYHRLSWIQLKSLLGTAITPTVNPVARYRADSGISHTNNTISRWAVATGTANDLLPQRSSVFLVPNSLNSKPVVRLNGTAFLASTNNFSNIREVFIVCNHRESGATFADFRRLIDFGDNTGSLFGVSGNTIYSPKGYTRNINVSTLRVNGKLTDSALPFTNYRLINFQFDAAATNRLWLGTYTGSGLQLFLGDIADVLLFDSYLDIKEKFAWQNEIMKYWGIS